MDHMGSDFIWFNLSIYWHFSKFLECLVKANFSSQSFRTFHNFNVELIWRHPVQCGTPEAWLECGRNYVNWIKNKCIKCELDIIEKYESKPIKNQESNRFRKTESNPVKNIGSNQVGKTWVESCWKHWFESSQENLSRILSKNLSQIES